MRLIKKYIYHPIKSLIAKHYLLFLRSFGKLKVIGITGSAGKTTTKEMIASILNQKNSTVWSKENIDPIYNIPSTILRCTPWTKYLVLEMGIEKPGEMDFYLTLIKPDVGVITNIFPTHTLFLKDVEGVFNEKSKLVINLEKSGHAILNKKSQWLRRLNKKIKAKIIWFNGENIEAAKCVGKIFGVSEADIKAGLRKYNHPEHRFQIINHSSGAVLVDDSYNSNPEAFISSLEKFNTISKGKTKIAVVGDMLELGDLEVDEHKRIRKKIVESNFKDVIGVGSLVKHITPKFVDTFEKGIPLVKKYLKPNNYIFVKGSRSIHLDKLIEEL